MELQQLQHCNTATNHVSFIKNKKNKKKFPKNSYTATEISYLCSVKQKGTKRQVLILKIATIKLNNCAH